MDPAGRVSGLNSCSGIRGVWTLTSWIDSMSLSLCLCPCGLFHPIDLCVLLCFFTSALEHKRGFGTSSNHAGNKWITAGLMQMSVCCIVTFLVEPISTSFY